MLGAMPGQAVIDLDLSGQDVASIQAIAQAAMRITSARSAAVCLVGQAQPVCVLACGANPDEAKQRAARNCAEYRKLQLKRADDPVTVLRTGLFEDGGLSFPLHAPAGNCLGSLSLTGITPGRDVASDVDLVSDLAETISPILLRAGAAHQLSQDGHSAKSETLHALMASMPEGLHGSRAPEEKLAVLMAAATDIISVRNIEDLQWHVAEEVVAKLGFVDCLIYRYEASDNTLHQSAAIGEKTPKRGVIINPLIIPVGRGITGAVAESRKPVLLEDAGADPRYVHDLMAPGSELCVPILHNDRLLGVIDSEHPETGWYTRDDLEMLTAIASLMASQWIQCELTQAIRNSAKRLKQAERAAASANRAKSEFVANMSHEIRTPLHGVLGAAQLLGRSKLDERQQRFVEIIQASGQTLISIIEDILDISNIEAGSLKWQERIFDLPATTLSATAGINVLAQQKQLEFAIHLADDLPTWVSGDPKRFSQILTNLLGNAVKYTDAGTVSLTLARSQTGGIRIEVEDTGPGLTPDEQAMVFDRFTRTEEHQAGSTPGAGLGLSICKEFVRIAGGELGVESEKGEGSTFWCELPMPPARAPAEGNADAVELEPHVANDRDVKRVLVVDDAESNRVVIRECLEDAGYTVLSASNAADALTLVREGRCDAVLMDIRMPVMRGDEAIAEIRSMPGDVADIPIFALTGDATPQTRDEVRQIGADAFFTKPLNLSQVRHELDTVLRGVLPGSTG